MSERLHELHDVDGADIETICAEYDLGVLASWDLCAAGLVNSNYRITTDTGSYLLRCYPADRKRTEIEFELSLLEHLDRVGFGSPRPVRARSGAFIGTLRGRLACVLTYIDGRTVGRDELTVDLAEQVGAKYAEFRLAVADFRPSGARANADYPLVSTLVPAMLEQLSGMAGDEAAVVAGAWVAVRGRFRDIPGSSLRVVHGDLFGENIIVHNGRLVAFIDFDDAYLGSPVLDLALVIMEFAATPDNRIDGNLAAAVMRAYRRVDRGLTTSPDELYDAFLFLCCKFLAYTLPLTTQRGEPLADNEYLVRLRHLRSDTTRAGLVRALAIAEEVPA